ncbi:Shwachman-Bodian-diamond syndrome protein [Lojkania enalia]|uniref:Shwachman-Bodian-diamond syndrome protein n=1 Tax=Lojkania enalia TaxID=147567 RepID=A0A9P4KDB4_9PLEO|nr:Shwachman-Bodian-diamond syndrome protein [Didymosphaeria enalia]
MPINQPMNQIKLTNVSYVRMKKGKKRYEIACYKNKVLEWRQEIEKDLDNVVQIQDVFLNVSRGEVAPKADLEKSFGKGMSRKDIMIHILDKGDIQVGDEERKAQLDRTHNEVINIVASKLVNPKTKLPYTTNMIEKALETLAKSEGAGGSNVEANGETKQLPRWRGVMAGKDAKKQANIAMKALIAHQPIAVAKARMRLRVTCPTPMLKHSVKSAPKAQVSENANENEDKGPRTVKDTILGLMEEVESQEVVGDEWEAVGFVDPGAVRTLTDFIGGQLKGRGNLEVLDMAVVDEED